MRAVQQAGPRAASLSTGGVIRADGLKREHGIAKPEGATPGTPDPSSVRFAHAYQPSGGANLGRSVPNAWPLAMPANVRA